MKRTTNGVSPLFVLCNLILATEKLTIYIYGIFTEGQPDGGIFLHYPPSAGDRFSLWHCVVVAILFLIPWDNALHDLIPADSANLIPVSRFIQMLFFIRYRSSIILIASYTGFLLISIVPLVWDAISPMDDEQGRELWSAIFYGVHSMLICPILTILGIWGFYRQAREIYAVPFPNALSLHGLAVQAIVFTFVFGTWIFCLPFPYEKIDIGRDLNWGGFTIWFQAIGFIIVDNFVFAVGQAVLLFLALRRSSSSKASVQLSGETEPLLGQHTSAQA